MLSSGVQPLAPGASPLLGALFAAVIAHGAGVEQADDCTQLVFRYNGAGAAGPAASGEKGKDGPETVFT